MGKSVKIIFMVVAGIIVSGCRSAKPTAAYEAVADSVAVSDESITSVDLDSVSITEERNDMAEDVVGFVDGGGTVHVASDGTLILMGVAEVRSSRHAASAERKDRKSLTEKSQSKDIIAAVHQSSCYSETKQATSPGCSRRIMTCLVYLAGFVVVLMIARRLRQTLINH